MTSDFDLCPLCGLPIRKGLKCDCLKRPRYNRMGNLDITIYDERMPEGIKGNESGYHDKGLFMTTKRGVLPIKPPQD